MPVKLSLAQTRPGRRELQNRRVTVWLCLRCGFQHRKPAKGAAAMSDEGPGYRKVEARPNACVACRTTAVEKFDSLAEAAYAELLMRIQDGGGISGLAFHPKLVARVPPAVPEGAENSVSYTADGTYLQRDGRRVVYDVKAKGAPLERDFILRRRIAEAAFGVKIEIVRR